MSPDATSLPLESKESTAAVDASADLFLSLKHGATEFYLIRHGDALPVAEEVLGNEYDQQSLSALGRKQAQALGERMRSLRLGAIYSSPIARAYQTAEAIAATTNIAVQTDDELREVALGPIGAPLGISASPETVAKLLRERLREIAVVATTSGNWATIPGSEPSATLRARIRGAIERIAGLHPGQRVAVVSHGGAINALLADMLGIERDYFFPAVNTSISVIRVNGSRRILFALNDINHLREAGLFQPEANE